MLSEGLRIDRFPDNPVLDNTIQNLKRAVEVPIVLTEPQAYEGALGALCTYKDSSDVEHLYIRLQDGWYELTITAL